MIWILSLNYGVLDEIWIQRMEAENDPPHSRYLLPLDFLLHALFGTLTIGGAEDALAQAQ
jgi:hypothetical protein